MHHHILIVVDKSEHIVARNGGAACVEAVVGMLFVGMQHISLFPVDGYRLLPLPLFLGGEGIAQEFPHERLPLLQGLLHIPLREIDGVVGEHYEEVAWLCEAVFRENLRRDLLVGSDALLLQKLPEYHLSTLGEHGLILSQHRADTVLGLCRMA